MTWGNLPRAVLVAAWLIPAVEAAAQNRITGIVRDETGEGIRGATIRAQLEGQSRVLTTATDERGRFMLFVTSSGVWVLTIEAPGFQAQTVGVPLRLTGRPANFEIELERREAPETVGVLAGIDPKAVTSELEAATALFDSGQYIQAIAAYRSIKAKAPALTFVDLQLGTVYLRMKAYQEAEAAFREVLKTDERHPSASYGMGEVKEATGQVAEALNWYRRAAAGDPMWGRPLLKLAIVARNSGDRDLAVRYLTQLVEMDPTSDEATEAAAMLKGADR